SSVIVFLVFGVPFDLARFCGFRRVFELSAGATARSWRTNAGAGRDAISDRGSHFLHAVDDGAPRYAGDGIYAAGVAFIFKPPLYLVRSRLCGIGANKGDGSYHAGGFRGVAGV